MLFYLDPKTRYWIAAYNRILEGEEYYPLKNNFAQYFKTGKHGVLIVHNIGDGFGDELIRIGGLVASLHDFNPELEITLVTDRKNGYNGQAFPNLSLLNYTEFLTAVRVGDYFAPPEMVFDFSRHENHFNPRVTEGLKTVIDKYPPLFLARAGVFSDTTHALETRFGWSRTGKWTQELI